MTQKAKQWLACQSETFSIDPGQGGMVGSLITGGMVGSLITLGYVKKEIKRTPSGPSLTGRYIITPAGKEWVKHQ
jgi:hypothetical protein